MPDEKTDASLAVAGHVQCAEVNRLEIFGDPGTSGVTCLTSPAAARHAGNTGLSYLLA